MTAAPEETPILFERHGPIAHLILNRPRKINCMNGPMYEGIQDAVAEIAGDKELRCVVVSGASGNFSSGGDFKWYRQQRLDAMERGEVWQYDYPAHRALVALDKPVIAAIDGHCIAAGLSFAMFFCDIRIASTRATFCFPSAKQGLGGTGNKQAYGMPFHHYLGVGNALYLMLTGEDLSADVALRMGIVSETVEPDQLLDRAMTLAARMAEGAPEVLAAYKTLYRRAFDVPASGFDALHQSIVGELSSKDYFQRSAGFLASRDSEDRG